MQISCYQLRDGEEREVFTSFLILGSLWTAGSMLRLQRASSPFWDGKMISPVPAPTAHGVWAKKAVNTHCHMQDHTHTRDFTHCATTAQIIPLDAGKSQSLTQICCGLSPPGMSLRQNGFWGTHMWSTESSSEPLSGQVCVHRATNLCHHFHYRQTFSVMHVLSEKIILKLGFGSAGLILRGR